MRYFILQRPKWGDYWDILISGDLERDPNGVMLLTRTGPAIPPIAVSSSCVVTQTLKSQLEQTDLKGLVFQPVILKKVVRIPWHEWDRTQPPPVLPKEGEPEEYLTRGRNSPKLAREMEPLWELCPPRLARIVDDKPRIDLATARRMFKEMVGKPIAELPPRVEPVVTYYLVQQWSAVGDHDFFRDSSLPPTPLGSKGSPCTYVSERAKDWLENRVGEWVDFEELKMR